MLILAESFSFNAHPQSLMSINNKTDVEHILEERKQLERGGNFIMD